MASIFFISENAGFSFSTFSHNLSNVYRKMDLEKDLDNKYK